MGEGIARCSVLPQGSRLASPSFAAQPFSTRPRTRVAPAAPHAFPCPATAGHFALGASGRGWCAGIAQQSAHERQAKLAWNGKRTRRGRGSWPARVLSPRSHSAIASRERITGSRRRRAAIN